MLKNLIVIIVILLVVGCASKQPERGFSGTGDFDAVEASKTRVSLGLTYLQNGNFSQAKFNLDKALEFTPRSGEANYAMAFYYEQVDENARAEEYFKDALDYSNNAPDILNSYGAFLCKQGKYEQAKNNFLKAVDDKSYVSTAETYENLALCSQSQGLLDEATAYFNTALNHQPTRASTLLYLTEIYVNEARWEDAKRALFKYERNASVNANSLWLQYQIAKGEQDVNRANDYASLLLRLYPDHEFTQKAQLANASWRPSKKITQKIKTRQQSFSNTPAQSNQPNIVMNSPSQNSTSVAPNITNSNNVKVTSKAGIQSTNKRVENVSTQDTNAAEIIKNDENPTFFHVVQPKENLFQISRKYNVKISRLVEWNNLADASSINIGSRLWVRDPNTNE